MKKFIKLTLATNKKSVVIDRESIAFAVENEENNLTYTRIFFKQLVLDDEAKWVDVLEKPEKIM